MLILATLSWIPFLLAKEVISRMIIFKILFRNLNLRIQITGKATWFYCIMLFIIHRTSKRNKYNS
jgi:hypothetical protein